MEFCILGPLEVLEDGQPLPLRGDKQRALLALLLLERGSAVSSDRLIDALWGERPPATARKSLRVHVSQLRKALGDGFLETREHGYAFRAAPGQLDLDRFERMLEEGRSALAVGHWERAAATLREGLGLWRGPPLADLAYEPFARSEIGRLEELRLGAIEDRVEADLALGRHAELVSELEALVRAHPFRERLRAQLMLALYRSGRQAAALETYQAGRRALAEDLGLQPGRALQDLERAILSHDEALDPQAPARAPPQRVRRRPLFLFASVALSAVVIASVVALSRGSAEAVAVAPNSVVVINPATNRIVADVEIGNAPLSMAAGGGDVWVLNGDDGTIARIDAKTKQVVRTFAAGETPTDIAFGAGALWIAQGFAGTLSRIDADSGVVKRTIPLRSPYWRAPVKSVSESYVAVGGGSIWVTRYRGEAREPHGFTWRVDPASGAVKATIGVGGYSISAGEDAVWVDNGHGDIARIDPATDSVTAVIKGPAFAAAGIAVGNGGVWATDPQSGLGPGESGSLWRIDPSRNTVSRTIPIGRSPRGVATGAGSVWVTNALDGTISRVDPRTNEVVATLTVGQTPRAVSVAYGLVWVTVD